MNITLQTNNFSSQKYYSNNNNRKNSNTALNDRISFKGGIEVPVKSRFLDPFKKGMDKLTDVISDWYTSKIYTSKLASLLSNKTEKLDSVVDHMQVLGSVIISGMYMTQTLRNKQLDDERKKTLAVNQFLTLVASTLLSYFVDKRLDKKWDTLTMKYAASRTDNLQGKTTKEKAAELSRELEEYNKKLEEEYNEKCSKLMKEKQDFKPTAFKKKNLVDFFGDEKLIYHDDLLAKKIRGMGVFKKLLVFGTIYRFISPVAITPLATWLGNKYIHKKDNNVKKEV